MPKATFFEEKNWPFEHEDYDSSKEIRVWFPNAPLNAPAESDPYGVVSPTLSGNIKVSVDFDNTLTAYPELFARLIHKIRKGGGKIYILTGRPLQDKQIIEDYLVANSIEFDFIETFPIEYQDFEKDSILDSLIGQFKGQRIEEIGIDIHIDDLPAHIKQIRKRNPELLVLRPWFDKYSSLLLFSKIQGE